MRKGFTLLEVIIVISVFSIVSLVSINTFLTTFRVSQQTTVENTLLDDTRFIVNQLSNAIQSNTIDYEEYFSHCVMNDDCPNLLYSFDQEDWETASKYTDFGRNHGYYSWQFFDGGLRDDENPDSLDGFGTVCQEYIPGTPPSINIHDYPNEACDTAPLGYSEDVDTGEHGSVLSNAFCVQDQYQQLNTDGATIVKQDGHWGCLATATETHPEFETSNTGTYMMDELYLISEDGERKTIFALETVSTSGDKVLSKVEMVKDVQAQRADGESLPLFGFTCADRYFCNTTTTAVDQHSFTGTAMRAPLRTDPYIYTAGEDIYQDFVPITPLRVNIKSLKFLVSPLEDPRRSFEENADDTKIQPSVMIFIEVEPSREYKSPFISRNFNLKLQTTVTSGIINEVPIISDSE
jgi:prepilin-type N-terminal cleavage/methylation domain-containing protein